MGIDHSGRWFFMGMGMCTWGRSDGTAAVTVTAGRRNPTGAAPAHPLPLPKELGVGKSLRGSGGTRTFLDPAVTAQVPPRCPHLSLHRRDRLSGEWGPGSSCTPSLPSPSDNPIFEPGD